MKFVIEHLEDHLSKWLVLEYEHASIIVGRENLVITNAGRYAKELGRIAGLVLAERVDEVYPSDRLLVLDPDAETPLDRRDFDNCDAVVVGGILGDSPRRHRTRKLLTSRLPNARARTLGPHQFSIDGAVYVALQVLKGARLEEVPVRVGVEIELPEGGVLELPYAYPLVNGKPLIYPRLVDYLRLEHDIERSKLVREELLGGEKVSNDRL